MSSIEYINALAARGIQLWAEGGKLQYKAPKEAVTPQLIAELKEHKAALVALLEQFAGTAGSYPLSYSQKSLWSLHRLNPLSAAYNVTYVARLDDELDTQALARGVDYLIARHAILRTRYAVVDGQPQQQVSTEASARLTVERVFGASDAAIREWIDNEANKPFDLAVSPIRLKLLVNAPDDTVASAPRHVLLLNVHHIAADFRSLEIMVRELSELYRLARTEQPLKLAPLSLHYKDCVQREIDRLQGPEGDALAAFWQNELRGGFPALSLAGDRPRPPVKTENGKVHAHAFGEPTSQSVRDAAKALQVTPYMLLLSVYQLFLFLHTGQSRLIIGAPTSGRGVPGSENVLGHFVNAVALACELHPGDRFAEVVARTRSMMLRVMDHQDYPFPLLVETMRPPRDPSRSPVFQVMYNWNQLRADAGAGGDAPALIRETLAASSTGTRGATHDLTLNIQDDGREYVAAWTFNTDLFDEATVARYAAQYIGLLQQVLVDSRQTLSSYRMTAPWTRVALLERIARAARNPDSGAGLPSDIASHANGHRTRPAWRLGERVLRYADVVDGVQRLRAALVALGVGADSVVAVQVSSDAERAATVLALLELGASACLVDACDVPVDVDAIVRGSGDRRDAWDPGSASITKESSSGAPGSRAAATTAAQIGRFIEGAGRVLGLEEGSRPLLLAGTEPHLAVALLLATLACGATACMPDAVSLAALVDGEPLRARTAAAALGAWIVRHQASALAVPALVLPAIADSGLESLRALVLYGEHPHAIEQAGRAERAPAALRFLPGPSLAAWVGPVALHRAESGWCVMLPDTPYPVPVVLGPFGDLADEHQAGRLQLLTDRTALPRMADSVAAREHADLGHALIHHHIAETPLIASWRAGELVCAHPSCRVADHRWAPFSIGPVESFIAAQSGVREVACIVQEMPQGPVFTAYVSGADEVTQGLESNLRRRLKHGLPELMHPDAIVLLDRLPLAADGCLELSRLPLPQAQSTEVRAASSEVERELAAIWCEVLSLPAVGVDDDFFALGGDSILAAVIVSRAGAAGLYIKPKDLFEHTTIAGLAQVVSTAPEIQAEQGAVTGSVVVGPAAAWFFERVDVDRSHFNQALLVELSEAPDAMLMQEAMRRLAQQHDVLRSRFVQQGAQWRQAFDDGAMAADWAMVPCAGTDGRIDAGLRQEAIDAAQSTLDIERGPLWRLRWLDGGTLRDSRLLIVVHHLLIDGVSWSLLLSDLADIYTRLRAHTAAKLPLKTSSAKAWTEQWVAHAGSRAMADERDHWLAFGTQVQRALRNESVALLSKEPAPPAGAAPGSCAISLDPSLTAAFRTGAHQAYGTDADDLLLAALHAGVRAWSGRSALLVDVEGHGRAALAESVDLSRTIGWFTSIHPVLLEAPDTDDPAALIKRVKQGLREVPNKGAGFGVLRHVEGGADEATREALAALPASPVLFTYLGTLDTMAAGSALFAGAIEPAPGIRSPRQRRTHTLDICAYVSGGRLSIECGFDAATIAPNSVARLMSCIEEALTTLLRHCCSDEAGGLTPSDVPGLDIDQDDLDALLDEVAALAP